MKFLITLSFLFLFINWQPLLAQSYINVQGSLNYWQHTELMGVGVGLGYAYKFRKTSLRFNYDYGYGWKDRIKTMNNIDYDNWSTVFVKTKKEGKWDYYHPYSKSSLYGKSDFGKQHQLSIHIDYPLFTHNKIEYNIGIGTYASIVEQFFTLKNIPVEYVDLTPFYRGPLNYIPTASRRILTYGVDLQFFLNIEKGNKIWSPFISAAYGPGYGSYGNIGLRLSTQLKKKER